MEDKKQNIKRQIEYGRNEVGEDATRYGEFISTYFKWVTPKQQKEKVEELEKMTDGK